VEGVETGSRQRARQGLSDAIAVNCAAAHIITAGTQAGEQHSPVNDGVAKGPFDRLARRRISLRRGRQSPSRQTSTPVCGLVLLAACSARAAGYEWSPPANRAVQVHPDGAEGWKVTSTEAREFTLESEQRLAAQPGDAFEINLRLRADLNTRAMPELVGYDAQGRELPARSALVQASWVGRTDWRSLHRVLPVPPGATSVRARLRARGAGEVLLGKLEFQPAHVDPYTTGALISQPHPTSAGGVVLESNTASSTGTWSRPRTATGTASGRW